jgi:hypothetical protein
LQATPLRSWNADNFRDSVPSVQIVVFSFSGAPELRRSAHLHLKLLDKTVV